MQDAQDPLEGFTEMYTLQDKVRRAINKKKTVQKKTLIKQRINKNESYVITSKPQIGRRLIRIEVIDLEASGQQEEDGDVLRAQYVVTDNHDPILDQTENIINSISKKLCGYSYGF